MTPTQILHAIYLSIIVAIIVLGGGAMIWWHHDAVLQGEAKVQAAQKEAAANQHLQDVKASQDVVDGLNQDIQHLRDQLNNPVPPVHVCGRVYHIDHPLPAGTGTAATPPAEPADGGANRGMPERGGSGDVGPGVRAIAAAGELDALYYFRLYDWAVKTR